MSEPYSIPAGRATTELVIQRSRFIAVADYTPTVEEAKAFIATVSRQEPAADHHVYAYAIGYGAQVLHGMSNAGEPTNTAGKPTLAVVKGSNLGDVTVVTSRYFGGIKLGTGGLVRAYTEAAQLVLSQLPRTEKVELTTLVIPTPYHWYEQIRLLAGQHGASLVAADFAEQVTLTVSLPEPAAPAFVQALSELSAGRLRWSKE